MRICAVLFGHFQALLRCRSSPIVSILARNLRGHRVQIAQHGQQMSFLRWREIHTVYGGRRGTYVEGNLPTNRVFLRTGKRNKLTWLICAVSPGLFTILSSFSSCDLKLLVLSSSCWYAVDCIFERLFCNLLPAVNTGE